MLDILRKFDMSGMLNYIIAIDRPNPKIIRLILLSFKDQPEIIECFIFTHLPSVLSLRIWKCLRLLLIAV